MALRKGKCYTEVKRAYTRKSKVKSKGYIKAIPTSKIAKYAMGEVNAYNQGKFKVKIRFISGQDIQLRDNGLEACRQIILRHLTETVKTFYCSLAVYPHHVLRENKMLTGAGADRMSSGMQRAFGKAVNLAAQVKKGQTIFLVACNEDKAKDVHKILALARAKIPGHYTIVEEKI